MQKLLKILTKEFLYRAYIINKKSALQIAKEVGCSDISVFNYLKKYGIKTRTTKESNRLNSKEFKLLTKSFLIKEYVKNKKSILTIAEEIGCSYVTIYRYLKIHKIKIRLQGESQKGINNWNWKGEDAVSRKNYYCTSFGCKNKISYGAWQRGIRRCKPCANIANSGKNHYMWNPNKIRGKYPIEWNRIYKESIRQHDTHQCQICGKTTKKNGRALDVHHIDYIKENLNPDNLITLCKSCHMKSNYNREIYIEYFKILNEIRKIKGVK